jgi:hypothetical protein
MFEVDRHMTTNNLSSFIRFLLLAVLLLPLLPACSKQNWYQGMQSAHEARCKQEPLSEYDDCMRQSHDSYDEYEKNRKDLSGDTAI